MNNVPYKGLRMRFWEFIIIKARRRGAIINYIDPTLKMYQNFIITNYKPILMEYRTPLEEEFIQGFEFEVRNDYKFGFIDFSDEKKTMEVVSKSIIWTPCKVTWKKTEFTTVKKDGYTYHISPEVNNFFEPFDVKSYLEQGLIRVKI